MLQQQLRSDAPASINDMAGPGRVGGLGERHHDHQEEHGDHGEEYHVHSLRGRGE